MSHYDFEQNMCSANFSPSPMRIEGPVWARKFIIESFSEVMTVVEQSKVSSSYLTRIENPFYNVRNGMIFVRDIQRSLTKSPEDMLCPWPLVLAVMDVFDVITAENLNVRRCLKILKYYGKVLTVCLSMLS